ncbi:MAG: thioesterase family protein [Planctomycetota bacterium]
MNSNLIRYRHEFRVAYHETDGQRRVHHSNYLRYFEDARVEMLRAAGIRYRSLEDGQPESDAGADGCLLVVTEMNVQYHAAAEFDDWLAVDVETSEIRKVRLTHRYRVTRENTLIASATSVIACVNLKGKPKRLPSAFLTIDL